jgi:hypothetical protein
LAFGIWHLVIARIVIARIVIARSEATKQWHLGLEPNFSAPCPYHLNKIVIFAITIEAVVAQMVEHQLPKLRVVGSIPICRSHFFAPDFF